MKSRQGRIVYILGVGTTCLLLAALWASRIAIIEWWYLERLSSPEDNVRRDAAAMLAKVGSQRAISALIAMIAAYPESAQYGVATIAALSPDLTESFIELWNRSGNKARAHALGAILKQNPGSEVGLSLAIMGFNDEETEVKSEARAALRSYGDAGMRRIVKEMGETQGLARIVYINIVEDAILNRLIGKELFGPVNNALVECVFDNNDYCRDEAVLVLPLLGVEIAPSLLRLIGDMNTERRILGFEILDKVAKDHDGFDEVLTHVARALEDEELYIRVLATRILGKLKLRHEIVVPLLVRILSGKGYHVLRQASLMALRDLEAAAKEAVPALCEVVGNDADPEIRCAAIKALGAIGPSAKAALPVLMSIERSTETTVLFAEAQVALRSIGRE